MRVKGASGGNQGYGGLRVRVNKLHHTSKTCAIPYRTSTHLILSTHPSFPCVLCERLYLEGHRGYHQG